MYSLAALTLVRTGRRCRRSSGKIHQRWSSNNEKGRPLFELTEHVLYVCLSLFTISILSRLSTIERTCSTLFHVPPHHLIDKRIKRHTTPLCFFFFLLFFFFFLNKNLKLIAYSNSEQPTCFLSRLKPIFFIVSKKKKDEDTVFFFQKTFDWQLRNGLESFGREMDESFTFMYR